MGELEAWTLLTGAGLPPFVAIIQQPRWSPGIRAVATVIVCGAVGIVEVSLIHGFHLDTHMLAGAAQVVLAAQVTYETFWRKTKVAPKIEAATSPSQEPHAHAA